MTIQEDLAQELREAIKAGDANRRDVIRQIETEVARAKSEPGFSGPVDDELYRKVIASYVRKMDKSRAEYLELGEQGARMAEKLGFEVDYLSRWLPTLLGEKETRELVIAAIEELGVAGDAKAVGRVTGHLMKTRGDELDGSLVARIAAAELNRA